MTRPIRNVRPLSASPIALPIAAHPVKKMEDLALTPAPKLDGASFQNIKQSLADRESYSALLLLNVPKTSNRATKRVIGQLSEGPLYSAKLGDDVPFMTGRTPAALLASLNDMDEGATLYVHWDAPMLSEPDPEKAAGEDPMEKIKSILGRKSTPMASAIESFARDAQARRPDIKIVIAVPASDVSDKEMQFVETMALDKIHYEFGAVSFAQRVDKYTRLELPGVDSRQAVLALRPVSHDVLRAVVHHAHILTTRRRTNDPYAEPDKLAALRESVKLFDRRANGPDNSEDAQDTSYVRQFLVPDAVLKDYALDTHVAGVSDEIKSFAKMLRNYDTYKRFMPEANKNLLLEGPVGTGKTTIARAIAAELEFPLFAPKSSELINSYIGKSAANVYKLFKQVREYARQRGTTAVVFIDEADAVLSRRGGAQNAEREYSRVVNAFLESLEGLDEDACNRLVVILSTNLAENLDPGIASRFGANKIEVPLPDVKTLQAIFKIHLEGRKHNLSDDDIAKVAAVAHKFSGRDVVNALRAADRVAFARMPEGAKEPPPITLDVLREEVVKEVAKRAKGIEAPPPPGMYT